jgi:polyhydroxybutyrate depolymerase
MRGTPINCGMFFHTRRLAVVMLALGARAVLLSAQSSGAGPSSVAGEPRSLMVNGESRRYYLHLPTGWRRDHPAALVLVFHAGGGRARDIAPHTGFSRAADRDGFVVVYPQGLRGRWNDGRGFPTATHDDIGFVRALLDTLGRELAIDPRRVYATGISNGAMFAYRLACDLPGTFAAIAPVAGAFPAELVPGCGHVAPVSVLAFQGTADPLMPYLGGGAGRRRVLSAERSVGFWATLAGCTGTPVITDEPDRVADGTRVRHTTYLGCREGRAVELYTIEGGGHTWPGGPEAGRRVGRVSREIDATAVIWRFFAGQVRE